MSPGGARAHIDTSRRVTVTDPSGLRGNDDLALFGSLTPPLFLVDANNLLWRAAHGHPAPFTATDGRDLTPLFRFWSMLRRALGTYGVAAECVVCFDGAKGWDARLTIDSAYKANRVYDGAKLAFMHWIPEIRAALACAQVRCLELEDAEADDVIASLTAAATPGRLVRILSTDRDYYQLISDRVAVVTNKRKPGLVESHGVVREYGVEPFQWCDFRALAGDPSDGISGVAGIGPKRAAALLGGGLALEDLHGSGRLDTAVGRGVAERFDEILRWRELIRLRLDLALPWTPTGDATAVLPSATTVCRELGLVAHSAPPERRRSDADA